MERSKRVDGLRGLAIVLVLLGHSIILFPINLHDIKWCNILFNCVAAFHLPLFYCISGFCYHKYQSYKEYIWKKIKKLIIPYLVFSCFSLLLKVLFPSVINGDSKLVDELISIVFYGGSYSFLFILFVIFLVFPLVEKILLKWRTVSLIVIALVSLGSVFLSPLHHIFAIDNVCYYLLFFSIGYYVRNLVSEEKKRLVDKKYSTVLLVFGLMILVILMTVNYLCQYRFIGIASSLMGILVLTLIFGKLTFLSNLFSDVGKYTLQLYLLKGYFLVVSRTIICSVLHVKSPAIIISFNMLIDFGLSYLIIKYIIARIKPLRVLMGL